MGFNDTIILEEGVSSVTATNSVQLGTRRVENGDEYVYCYNNTGSQATQGALMIQSAVSGYSLTRSSTDALDFPLAVVKNASVPVANYFWGLTRGSSYSLSGAMAAGELITVGADGAIATFITATLATGVPIGKCLVAGTANGGAICYFRLYG